MILKKVKKFLVGEDSETFAISLVSSPAIMENYLYFKEQEGEKLQVALETNDQHMIAGPVLIPNRPIYRYDEETNEEYYIEFTEEAIKKMAYEFLTKYRNQNFTTQHEQDVAEVSVVETWIKQDAVHDKSVALGLSENIPVGSWIIEAKVNNVDVWERVRSGELKGFSVEALCDLKEFNFNKVEEKLEEAPTPQPEPEPVVEPEPVATQEPVVAEPEPVVTTEPVVAEPEPVDTTTEPEPAQAPTPQTNPLEDLVQSLKAELDELKKANGNLIDKVKELEKMPSTKPVIPNGGNATVAATGVNSDSFAAWRESLRNMM